MVWRLGGAAVRLRSSPDEGRLLRGKRPPGVPQRKNLFLSHPQWADRSIEDSLLVTELTIMCQGPWIGEVWTCMLRTLGPFLSPSSAELLIHSQILLWVSACPLPSSTLTGFKPELKALPDGAGCPQGVTAMPLGARDRRSKGNLVPTLVIAA